MIKPYPFKDDRNLQGINISTTDALLILTSKVEFAVKELNYNNSFDGKDGLTTGYVKFLEEGSRKKLTSVFNLIYQSDNLPEDCLVVTFIVFPKKSK